MPDFTDHPRIRGEHQGAIEDDLTYQGSPPHTRGTPRGSLSYRGPARITPAYAGNTAWPSSRWSRAEDHPRIRGEHDSLPSWIGSVSGSPPHTRGTLASNPHHLSRKGITPAYAGNT